MIVNYVRNVNDALARGLGMMRGPNALSVDTRNGKVLRSYTPVTTVSPEPHKRVLFSPMRGANPFFHYMEALWMLAGQNDLPWLAQFNKRMAEYSDDGGKTQPAAYGFRWREHFGYNQLTDVIHMLRDDPTTRRAVLTMWDGGYTSDGRIGVGDLTKSMLGSKDVPCNTHIYFSVMDGSLQMMVCCRSNDLWWGAHGANAVHFSVLHEYVAAATGLNVGTMTQVSNDYHLYTDIVKPVDINEIIADIRKHDKYIGGQAMPTALFYDRADVEAFDRALPAFMAYASPVLNPVDSAGRRAAPSLGKTGSFAIDELAYPMLRVWDAQKFGTEDTALSWCAKIGTADNCDWRVACLEWVQRKYQKMRKV